MTIVRICMTIVKSSRIRIHTATALILFAALSVCALPLAAQPGFTQTGQASYYGKKFHGRKTANGERFNMWALTAAHKTIPFGSHVRVTNLDNGKSIDVRINDYGPFRKGRIIDLSRGAAAKIGMIKTGTARVKLEVLGDDGKEDHQKSKGNVEYYAVDIRREQLAGWAVQIASFEKMENLIRYLDRLRARDIDNVFVQMATVKGKLVHRLVVGAYETEAAARWKQKTMKEQGVDGFVFRIP
ncbi:septal ring lytic transglycosylase RlpA family protein [bacterium]|nr:septal ring lytic transglycosylase RlpA family protein [bacterium]